MTPQQAQDIEKEIARWTAARPDILALGLAGSWARQAAREDSDIDFILLCHDKGAFRSDKTWLDEIDWSSIGLSVRMFDDESYGLAWSRRILTNPDAEIEMTFGETEWAAVNPIDAGTRRVVTDGFRIIVDKQDLFSRLLSALR